MTRFPAAEALWLYWRAWEAHYYNPGPSITSNAGLAYRRLWRVMSARGGLWLLE